jgi:hypothetical protein
MLVMVGIRGADLSATIARERGNVHLVVPLHLVLELLE